MNEKSFLICFPYAGGDSTAFEKLKEALAPDIQVIGMEYPGHGTRFREKLPETWDELLTDMSARLRGLEVEGHVSLLGYSMGSLVSYELIRRGVLPWKVENVFLLSHSAPHMTLVDPIWTTGDDFEIVTRMQSLGGFQRINKEIVNSKYFQLKYMKPLKADYFLLQNYQAGEHGQENIPANVYYSELDHSVCNVEAWREYFSEVTFQKKGTDHFILKDHYEDIARMIKAQMKI